LDGGSARRMAATYTQTQNKCTQTSMPRVGFEPTTPVFERARAVHALYCDATVADKTIKNSTIIYLLHKEHVKGDIVKRLSFLHPTVTEAGHHDRLIRSFFSSSKIA
jgi:hypothetical protein